VGPDVVKLVKQMVELSNQLSAKFPDWPKTETAQFIDLLSVYVSHKNK
jgi:hypothetical protein